VIDEAGRPVFQIAAARRTAGVRGDAQINDGGWHHLLAEADRESGRLNLYLDGKRLASAQALDKGLSLANEGDLYVAGTPHGGNLACTLEFLRVALGTLADSRTTIEELHTWQFDGPFLRDFTGAEPVGKRDAGAIEQK
jgi:hypothetical protein